MRNNYGMMDSFDNCIRWVEELEVKDPEYKDRVLNRFRYERDKAKPVKPTFRKGKYGTQYDTYTCGHCGFGVNDPVYRFCPNCGFAICELVRGYDKRDPGGGGRRNEKRRLETGK